jgi:hypothetical protein
MPERTVSLLLAGALTAAVAAATTCAVPGAATGERRYVDRLGWLVVYPPTMQLERSQASLRIDVSEVTVANFAMRRAVRSGATANGAWLRVDPPRDRQGAFPADGVAFRIVRREGGPAPDVERPESRFPIRLSTFGRGSMYPNTTPRPIGRTVVADGRDYVAQAWIGPKASTRERAALQRAVASLSFPRLRVGQTVGYGFRVLEPASRYPVGSFTSVHLQGQPFYLVHAPGGFYAVGWTWETLRGGYKSRCTMRLDRSRMQFFCSNMLARWDRVGRVLLTPQGAARGDPLNLTVAKVAWDGHLLLFPDVARFADARYAHQLWPQAYPSR